MNTIMEGVIKLLPDIVANQIAAGEVIQRPASAVKELMENSVDAGSSIIELWINDAGKRLIMVVDNGVGMSPADSRLCFERHATSKISSANDLFAIKTFGFRGEALASIAAVSQLELKSRRAEDEIATMVRIEGGKITSQEPDNLQVGTTIAVKNLFYNIPARRNFLKGNNVELKHITEEFIRVALANIDITFKMFNEGRELYNLPVSNLKQRIVNIYGGQYNNRFVPVEQQTDLVEINGYIGKPEFAKKKRGEQYFFVNGRFFKTPYLHHAILKAYSELIPESSIPSYFIFLKVDPSTIDVNIHPTKTEVNFQEGSAIYAILHTSIRNSLGKFNLTPSIEFEPEVGFNQYFPKNKEVKPPTIKVDPNYNPFETGSGKNRQKSSTHHGDNRALSQHGWMKTQDVENRDTEQQELFPTDEELCKGEKSFDNKSESKIFQLHNSFIVAAIKSGLLLINQQYAHQRILYEQFIQDMANKKCVSQKLLLPVELDISKEESTVFDSIKEYMTAMGFAFNKDEKTSAYTCTAIPADMPPESISSVIESLMEAWQNETDISKVNSASIKLSKVLASKLSIKTGVRLSCREMQTLVDRLFNTEQPEISPSGKKVYIILQVNELEERFK